MDWPCEVWVFLQWYNISAAGLQQQACRHGCFLMAISHKLSRASTAQVIFAKVIFQLSVFCEDGTLNYEGCPSMCGSDMPTTALLGLASHSQADASCNRKAWEEAKEVELASNDLTWQKTTHATADCNDPHSIRKKGAQVLHHSWHPL